MQLKRTVVPIVFTLVVALLLPASIMAQDATEEPVEPAATEEAMEESTSEDGVNVTDVTIEAPEMTEEPVAETTPAPADTDDESTDVAGQTEYTIVQGDTLFSIARRFGVSVTALAEANDIVNPNRIFWGQVLEIPAEGGTGGPVDPNNPDETLRTYQVREGDTLFRIAANNDTTVTRLLELNPDIENVNVIFIGQDVLIPSS